MPTPRKNQRRKKPKKKSRHRVGVWWYPATEDNKGPIHWALSCTCGKNVHGLTESAARQAGSEHRMEHGDEEVST